MSDSDKNLENQILEAGEKLIDPPSSVDELLSLLDVSSLTIPLYLFFYFLLPLRAMLSVCMYLVWISGFGYNCCSVSFLLWLIAFPFIKLCESNIVGHLCRDNC